MAGFSTTSGGLNFQYPNRDTENWDAVMANSFTTISSHDHDRDTAGRGKVLNDRSILATNTGWFQATDFAGTGTVNLIRANTSDLIELGANVATLGVTGAVTLSSTLGVTGATTLSSTLSVTSAATFGDLVQISANDTWFQGKNAADSAYINLLKVNTSDDAELGADLDIKTNVIKTTTTNGDVELVPDGTGRVRLGDTGPRVENGVGALGQFLMTNGVDSADFKTLGWEVVDSTAAAGQAEILFDLSTYSAEFTSWVIYMTGVGGSVSSYPTVEPRTPASGAITSIWGKFDVGGFVMASGNAIHGSSTAGTGTAKHCLVSLRYNAMPNNTVAPIMEGWFLNTAGNNMPVFGFVGSIVGELAFKNAAGTLNSTGTVYLLGKRS